MALSEGRAVAGGVVRAADLNQIIDALEGDTDETMAYHLRSESGEDFIVTLSDAAGAREFQVKDSAGTTVFSVDSDGNVTQAGAFDPGSITLPASTSPTPITEGAMAWDSDDDQLVIGNGTDQTIFIPRNKVWRLVGSDLTERSNATNGGGDMSTVTWSEAVPATVPMLITYAFRAPVATNRVFGLKLNSTTVLSGTAVSGISGIAQGNVSIYIPPREAGYLQSLSMAIQGHTVDTATGANGMLFPTNDAPTDPINSITIRGGPTGSLTTVYIKNVYVYRLAVQ